MQKEVSYFDLALEGIASGWKPTLLPIVAVAVTCGFYFIFPLLNLLLERIGFHSPSVLIGSTLGMLGILAFALTWLITNFKITALLVTLTLLPTSLLLPFVRTLLGAEPGPSFFITFLNGLSEAIVLFFALYQIYHAKKQPGLRPKLLWGFVVGSTLLIFLAQIPFIINDFDFSLLLLVTHLIASLISIGIFTTFIIPSEQTTKVKLIRLLGFSLTLLIKLLIILATAAFLLYPMAVILGDAGIDKKLMLLGGFMILFGYYSFYYEYCLSLGRTFR